MPMNNILPVKEGSEVSMYNILDIKGQKGKPGRLYFVYRDETGHKKTHFIKDALMEYYFTKESKRTFNTAREYIKMEDVYPVIDKPAAIPKKIYEEAVRYMNKLNTIPGPSVIKNVTQARINSYEQDKNNGDYQGMKNIQKWPYVHMSDLDLETYYWIQMGYNYNLTGSHVIDRCFGDIENDVYNMTASDQLENKDPVNAFTLIFKYDDKGHNAGKKIQVYTFLLRNYDRYPQQEYFEEHLDDFIDQCHKSFDIQTVKMGGKEKNIEVPADYHIILYDNEEELLIESFKRINTEKPDLCEFWNMPYDMPKLKARMEKLDLNPYDIICDTELFPKEYRRLDYHMDNRPIDIANKNSYIRLSSTTQYIDQMQHYAGIRKGRKAYGSNSLDNIAKIELGMGKWKFGKGINVINACVKDYWNFVLYNIRDVWCQVLIDDVTNDSMALIYDSNQMNCPLYHLAKQTRYQRYIYYTNYLRMGYVPGNNINVDYKKFTKEEEEEAIDERDKVKVREYLSRLQMDRDDANEVLSDPTLMAEYLDMMENDAADTMNTTVNSLRDEAEAIFIDSPGNKRIRLQGGLVGNPDHNIANGEELIEGNPSKHVFTDICDMDYSSEYPWAKYTRSLSRSTQMGRLIISEKISDRQNTLSMSRSKPKEDLKYYIPGAEFTADYLSQDYLSFGNVWFNLPTTEECRKLIGERLKG